MDSKGILQSERVGKRVQVGIIPTVVGTIQTRGASGLLGTFGVSQSVLLLVAFVTVRVYLLTASVRDDVRRTS